MCKRARTFLIKKCDFVQKMQNFLLSTFNIQLFFVPLYRNLEKNGLLAKNTISW